MASDPSVAPDGQAQPRMGRFAAGRVGRLRWRSRRGMAELELRLLPFFDQCFAELSRVDQGAYGRLLEEDDWQIQDWLLGCSEPSPPLARIVSLIGRHGQAQGAAGRASHPVRQAAGGPAGDGAIKTPGASPGERS